MIDHHLPDPEDLLPILEQLLHHLRGRPIGTSASGSYLTREDAARLARGERAIKGGVCIIVTTDPEAIAKDLARALKALARGDISVTEFEEPNRG